MLCAVLSGSTLFIGGSFTQVAGVNRNNIAAIDVNTGALLSWYPSGGASSQVTSMVLNGTSLFVSGAFTTIGGSTRSGIAALNPSTGAVLSWYPTGGMNIPGNNTLRFLGGVLYVSGNFTTIGGSTRNRLAALNPSTGAVLSWYPTGGSSVPFSDMVLIGSVLIICGQFTTIGGVARIGIAAVDASTAAVLSWYPTGGLQTPASGNSYGSALYVDTVNQRLIVTGPFGLAGGIVRNGLCAFDASNLSSADVLSWYPTNGFGTGSPSHVLMNVGVLNESLIFSGVLNSYSDRPTNGLVLAQRSTGQLIATIEAVPTANIGFIVNGSSLIIFGSFSSINGQTRANVAQFSVTS
ncbi:hypothetical protein [Leptospira langatensis]|uniref:hypothetical protein n=1 Tax=Leptospira langatensis TaxID=2484983 RepID=UPI0014382D69|nr:hypothetical protein [Leptospira langatensis]